ncbi:Bardet-Biedl syndrome 10 protein-like isoform X1 [Limulus polyphemus]|uniref:Bardet-Biedl syndrome 10 protein-like isoform X1 n=1 Tax=Limulus polyphemus TaxID=6850 RepID=A0ABM1TE08_LIMPO|nr:Bardet-Biedl syndrome 10 protein-like isoform X1 [Limulus polyphemus]
MSEVTVNFIKHLVDYIGSLVEKSYGPYGRSSLCVSAVGQIEITSSGISILETARVNHPVATVITRAVKNHHELVGDGTKTFILLLKAIFNELSKYITESSYIPQKQGTMEIRTKLRLELSNLLYFMLPEYFGQLRANKMIQNIFFHENNLPLVKSCVQNLLKTFLTGKFGQLVTHQLVELCYNLIFFSVSDISKFNEVVQYLIKNFHLLCCRINVLPIQLSRIVEGFVLTRDFTVPWKDYTSKEEEFNFIVILSSQDNQSICNGAILKITQPQDIEMFLLSSSSFYKSAMKAIQQHQIQLILSCNSVSESFKTLCYEEGIAVIAGIPREELLHLVSLCGIQPIICLQETLNASKIGKAQFARPITLEAKWYIQIGIKLSNLDTLLVPHYLVLCGPTEGICKQYFSESFNSLKVVASWIDSNCYHTSHGVQPFSSTSFCQKDSSGIKVPSKSIGSCDISTEINMPKENYKVNLPVSNVRQQSKLGWFEETCMNENWKIHVMSSSYGHSLHSTLRKSVTEDYPISSKECEYKLTKMVKPAFYLWNYDQGVSCPGSSFWELTLISLLRKSYNRATGNKNAIAMEILASSLFYIPILLHKTSLTNKQNTVQVYQELEESLQKSLQVCMDGVSGCVISVEECTTRESVASKELLLCNVLKLVIQLLKLDGIVNIPKLPKVLGED